MWRQKGSEIVINIWRSIGACSLNVFVDRVSRYASEHGRHVICRATGLPSDSAPTYGFDCGSKRTKSRDNVVVQASSFKWMHSTRLHFFGSRIFNSMRRGRGGCTEMSATGGCPGGLLKGRSI
jgi:hypothetical protein